MQIKLANCCSCCEYTKVPKENKKTFEPHAAHYEVAKTLRWCYRHSVFTAREGICDDFKFRKNSAGVKAVGMANKRNERLSIISRIVDFFNNHDDIVFVQSIKYASKYFICRNNKIYRIFDFQFERFLNGNKDNKTEAVKNAITNEFIIGRPISAKETYDAEECKKSIEHFHNVKI